MKNKRDLNEREIISTLVAAGAYVKQMDRHAGFDLLVCHAGVVYVAEVKAPGGRFTQAEMDTEAAITAAGCKYWVLRDFMDALRMIRKSGKSDWENEWEIDSYHGSDADSAARIGGNPKDERETPDFGKAKTE